MAQYETIAYNEYFTKKKISKYIITFFCRDEGVVGLEYVCQALREGDITETQGTIKIKKPYRCTLNLFSHTHHKIMKKWELKTN